MLVESYSGLLSCLLNTRLSPLFNLRHQYISENVGYILERMLREGAQRILASNIQINLISELAVFELVFCIGGEFSGLPTQFSIRATESIGFRFIDLLSERKWEIKGWPFPFLFRIFDRRKPRQQKSGKYRQTWREGLLYKGS